MLNTPKSLRRAYKRSLTLSRALKALTSKTLWKNSISSRRKLRTTNTTSRTTRRRSNTLRKRRSMSLKNTKANLLTSVSLRKLSRWSTKSSVPYRSKLTRSAVLSRNLALNLSTKLNASLLPCKLCSRSPCRPCKWPPQLCLRCTPCSKCRHRHNLWWWCSSPCKCREATAINTLTMLTAAHTLVTPAALRAPALTWWVAHSSVEAWMAAELRCLLVVMLDTWDPRVLQGS